MNAWGWIVFVILVCLFAIQTWYYVEMTWLLKRVHQREIADMEAEMETQDQMLKNLTLPQVMVVGEQR